ncbi:hypothetical protein RM844_25280 [Streptomyces sp. DSM 44915]|uniref:Uncharacterized protein n=1 Tax=Streptomyces chisholmiae TaxID=3075540 RepID=A0ABU2JXX2_9ACTN|nr:hypothetical protein [Streptomyces sp. DSM 44915]MDT0269601.1 hypothetical protein [Streptomyces sp. DSM 44915]
MRWNPPHPTARRRIGRRGALLALPVVGLVGTLLPGGAVAEPLAGPDEGSPYYATNPGGGVGVPAAITVDGEADEWTEEMVVAQGVANDDARIFRGSHEGPVHDLYRLSAAWDDEHLYLMWQYTNVTDVADPAQDYPQSGNGKPYAVDLPISLALDVDPAAGSDGLVGAGPDGVWDLRTEFGNAEVDHLANFSAVPGRGEPALFRLNAEGAFDHEPANHTEFAEAGIAYAHGDGLTVDEVWGIEDNGHAGYLPADLLDADLYTDLLTAGHDPAQDTVYEIQLPLAELGLTRASLEDQGLGVLLVATFGQSAVESLPHDPAVLDNALDPYGADPSTSHEKEDYDTFTVPFARVGALAP